MVHPVPIKLMHFFVCRQFTFVVVFSTFLLTCVNYDVLFKEGKYNMTQKVTIADAVYPVDTLSARYLSDFILALSVILLHNSGI